MDWFYHQKAYRKDLWPLKICKRTVLKEGTQVDQPHLLLPPPAPTRNPDSQSYHVGVQTMQHSLLLPTPVSLLTASAFLPSLPPN